MPSLSASPEISTGNGPHARCSAKRRQLIAGSPALGGGGRRWPARRVTGGRAVIVLTARLLPHRRSWPGGPLPPARPARAVPGLAGSAGPVGRGGEASNGPIALED